jgi:hypothetical protein
MDGMTQTRIPDRFIIRPVMDLSSRSIPYIMLRPDLVETELNYHMLSTSIRRQAQTLSKMAPRIILYSADV